ncbi:MAG: nucleoside triphosphate pyrophosphohydrolase [Alphaproteobacteria bacterium]|nr:nucleoside triphosphate pyrophosphohydrolase [Alphaproteobacteria bacterium]
MNEYTDKPQNLDKISKNMRELVLIMRKLRNKESGCEWDLKQTYNTIAPYTIEEAYEVAEAIYENDMDKLCDELGDLLLQVVFHSQIAYELGDFKLEDVIAAVCDKMIRRHPHIFGNKKEKDVTSIRKTWEEIKQQEREEKSKDGDFLSLLDGVSNNLPALMRALKLQQRVSKVGFDWPNLYPAIDKMYEEINELKEEIEQEAPDQSRIQDEIGDILFVATNIARLAGCEPETSLILSNRKFEKRFRQMEKEIRKNNQSIEALNLHDLEALWEKAKTVVG